MNDGGPIRLTEFLREELIVSPLQSTDAAEAVAELARALAAGGEVSVDQVDRITALVLRSERNSPTGIKRGLALPNCAAPGVVRTACALGISPDGIDFRCLDGEPARAVVLFVCPESTYRKTLLGLEAVAEVFLETRLAAEMASAGSKGEIMGLIEGIEDDLLLYENGSPGGK